MQRPKCNRFQYTLTGPIETAPNCEQAVHRSVLLRKILHVWELTCVGQVPCGELVCGTSIIGFEEAAVLQHFIWLE